MFVPLPGRTIETGVTIGGPGTGTAPATPVPFAVHHLPDHVLGLIDGNIPFGVRDGGVLGSGCAPIETSSALQEFAVLKFLLGTPPGLGACIFHGGGGGCGRALLCTFLFLFRGWLNIKFLQSQLL